MTYRQYFFLKLVLYALVVLGVVLFVLNGAEAEMTRELPYVAVVDVHPDSSLRCRCGPGTEYVGYVLFSPGARLLVLEERDGWAYVSWPNSPEYPAGWVCMDYLK